MRQLLFFSLVAVVIVVDQITKFLIRANMSLGESIPSEGLVRLTYTTNESGAFGLFGNQIFLIALTSIVGILILILYLRFFHIGGMLLKVGLALELGGAVGNLIDRVRLGEVTDFIDVGFWPVFNFADSVITIGAILIVGNLLFAAKKKAI
ncbi:signal peptidase II [Chloroflexota bacterium]